MSDSPKNSIYCIDPQPGDSYTYEALESKSRVIQVFSTPEECLLAIKDAKPNIVIVTSRGEEEEAIEFLTKLRQEHPGISNILHTRQPGQHPIKEAILEKMVDQAILLTEDMTPLSLAVFGVLEQPVPPSIRKPNPSTLGHTRSSMFPFGLLSEFSHALQLIGNALYVLDHLGNIVYSNTLGEAILGATSDQILNTPFHSYLPKDPSLQTRWLMEFLSTAKSKSLETKILHRGHTYRRVRLTAWPLEDQESGQQRLFILARDRTRNQLLEERQEFLEEALYQAQQFEATITTAGGLAHQFNNMLTPVFGLSELLCERTDLPEDVVPLLEEIKAGAERAANLVQNMLLSTRQGSHALQEVDVEQALWRAIRILKAKAPKNISINHDIRGPLPKLKGDSEHIHLMLLNIGSNALEAMESKGSEIMIRAYFRENASFPNPQKEDYTGPAIFLEITDNGPGIHDDFLPSIFHPFQSTDQINRAGMGLAVVRGIIDKHLGFIDACSEVGKGTSFYIYLPIDEEEAKPFTDTFDPIQERNKCVKTESKEPPEDRATILLLDDHEHVLLAISRMLESMDIEVDAFESPQDALVTFRNNPSKYSAILSDLKMPIMSGVDFAHAIRTVSPRIPIVILTGYMDIREALNEMPFDKLLAKPIIPSKLHEVLQQLIGDKLGNTPSAETKTEKS